MQLRKVSVVVPLFNEEKLVTKLLTKVQEARLQYRKEIIVVDDGSTDGSYEVVQQFIRRTRAKNITLLSKKNGGKGSALKLGFKHATGDVLIVQDADLEYDPRDYTALIKPIAEGKALVVYGSRLRRKNTQGTFSFLLGGLVVTLATDLLYFTSLTDQPTCYKVYYKRLKPLLISAEGNEFDWEYEVTPKLLRSGYRIVEVPIRYYPRTKKQGKKIKWRDGLACLWTLLRWRFKRFPKKIL